MSQLSEEEKTTLPALFQNTANTALEKFLSNIKSSSFKEKFRDIHNNDRTFFPNNVKAIRTQLGNAIKEELDELYKSENIFAKLQKIECLTAKFSDKEGTLTWRPSGNPKEDIRDHSYHIKRKHKDSLELLLKAYQHQNEKLEKKLDANHEEIMNLSNEVTEMNQQNNEKLEALTSSISFADLEELQRYANEEN